MPRDAIDLNSPSYMPNRLLNAALEETGCTSDYQLSAILEFSQAQLSRVRNLKEPVSDKLMVRIMDITNWHVTKVRALAGTPYDGCAATDL